MSPAKILDVRTAYKCRAYPTPEQAKTDAPLEFVWSWPDIDPASIDPSTVTVSRDPCGRWHVSFAVEVADPDQAPPTGAVVGADLGVKYFAVKKAKAKVARAHRKIRASRAGFLHKTSTRLVRDHDVIVIDRWYPSSKTCSACGHLLAELSLGARHWTCPGCGTRRDRDVNAAKNILAAGLAVAACGGDVRHSESSRVQSPVKQEHQPVKVGIPRL